MPHRENSIPKIAVRWNQPRPRTAVPARLSSRISLSSRERGRQACSPVKRAGIATTLLSNHSAGHDGVAENEL